MSQSLESVVTASASTFEKTLLVVLGEASLEKAIHVHSALIGGFAIGADQFIKHANRNLGREGDHAGFKRIFDKKELDAGGEITPDFDRRSHDRLAAAAPIKKSQNRRNRHKMRFPWSFRYHFRFDRI